MKKNLLKFNVEYNKWNYELTYKNDSPIPTLKVEPDEPYEDPKTLSKYYSLNENNVLAFLNNEFYVSQPDQLNDLFDSNLNLINFDNISFEYIIPILNPKNIELAKYQFKKDKESFLSNIKTHIYKKWITLTGSLCLTDNKYNELMWSHYTNHEGFLVEFEYSKFNNLFMGPYPINYIPQIEPIDFGITRNNLGLFILSLIKKEIWKYENEYRFLCRPENGIGFKVNGTLDNSDFHPKLQRRFINYTKESIKKIILGFAFFKNDIDRQNADYTNHKYNVIFTGKNPKLKTKLFNYLVENRINVELVAFDSSFDLIPIPIDITKINEVSYYIEEQRDLVKIK